MGDRDVQCDQVSEYLDALKNGKLKHGIHIFAYLDQSGLIKCHASLMEMPDKELWDLFAFSTATVNRMLMERKTNIRLGVMKNVEPT